MNDESIQFPAKRPQMLTILCVLSFIGSGLTAISNLFVFFNHEVLIETIQSDVFKDLGYDLGFLVNTDKSYFILSGLLSVVSFTGVRNMWQLRKAGFHLYSLSQLLMLIVSTIYVYRPSGVFPLVDLLFASIFILSYLRFKPLMQ
ncbi:MAG: hypothetical protein IT219_01110 [Bacteroidales bacterium]|jgi:hypothetical protein|nr:hypothetical protein [Bacteroidales bacterium]